MIRFDPEDRTLNTFSAFIQDTITLVPNRLFVMGGSKFEHNDMTGFEVQPSGRIWWTPNDDQIVWAAISRPVRLPSRVEDLNVTVQFVPTAPGMAAPIFSQPNQDLAAEEVITAELGHRIKLTGDLTLDTAGFYSNYDRLIQIGNPTPSGFLPPPFPPGIPTAIALHRGNAADAESYGLETSATFRVSENWRLTGSYSFMELRVGGRPSVIDDPQRSHPEQMAQLRSALNITKDLEFNSALYYVDHIAAQGAPGYLRMDLGLTFRPTQNLELAIWGQNLLDPRHREFNDILYLARPAEVPRAIYVQATLRF